MRGRAEHSVVEIHICERNHIVAKTWRNSGHNNKNNRDSFAAMFFAYRQSHGQFCWESAGPNCMNVGSKIGKLVTTARVARN